MAEVGHGCHDTWFVVQVYNVLEYLTYCTGRRPWTHVRLFFPGMGMRDW